MQQLANESNLLDTVSGLNGRFLERVRSFSDDTSLRNLSIAYEENRRNRNVNLGFNVFALVSDVYYRENFHSDVIEAILNPNGGHGQGDLFLRLFLEFIRDRHGVTIRVEDYAQAKLERESGRIDLLIYDKNSEKAIIIENKINGAGDMDRQVARYLETVEDVWGYRCDAIIYLTLDFKKTPHTHGWNDEERARVKPLLQSITAFEDSPEDLYQGWLEPCHDATQDSEVAHVIRQYRQLILNLGQNAMNKPLMEEYYQLMLDTERHKAALSLIDMMNDLQTFRHQRLMDTFRTNHHPFFTLWSHKNTIAIFEGLPIEGASRVKIHVETTSNDRSKVSFWDNADDSGEIPERILKEIGLIDQFSDRTSKWRTRTFQFPADEQSLYDFLGNFLQQLRDHVIPAQQIKI